MTIQYLESLPHIDFRVFMEPLEDLVLTASNKLEREWPPSISAHRGSQMVLRLLLSVSHNTYRTMRYFYFCADVPEDPSRKLEYAVSAPPLARTILDALFTLVFIADKLEERTAWYLRSGWREMKETLERLRHEYSADESWAEYLTRFEKVVRDDQQLWRISGEEAANYKSIDYWPIPSQILRLTKGTPTGEYLKYLDNWFYRELSQESHLSWPGLFRRGGWFLFDRPGEEQRVILNKAKSDSVSTAVILLAAMISELEMLLHLGLATRVRYLWGLFQPIATDARKMFEMRYESAL